MSAFATGLLRFARNDGAARLILISLFIYGCVRAPLKKREDAMRPSGAPTLSDDLAIEPLVAAVRAQAAILRAAGANGKVTLGKRTISKEQYALGLETFARLAETITDRAAFLEAVKENFEFHEAYGGDGWGDVMVTSYFEPEISGSSKKTDRFTTPILKSPGDLVDIALSKYDDRFSDLPPMRGRLSALGFPPGQLQLLPYYTREEIDGGGVLSKRGLEMAWADPIDAFFVQIQGSGTVVLEDGKRLRIGYADQNGHKYESIGKFMVDVLPKGKISLQTIEAYLRGLSADQIRSYLFRNPSYVFFREREGLPVTMFGTPAVAGRTIATDARYFPKGALAFLSFEKPRFDSPLATDPSGFDKTSRFVVDDDTGGAIRGGGRVDLFWGSGPEARRSAGVLKNPGRLFYLAPKEALLQRTGTK